MRSDRLSPWLLCAVALVAGCGGGGDGLPVSVTPPPPTSPPSTSPPTITAQPASQTVAAGGTASFSVAASNGPLVYQWLSAPSLVAVFSEIPGATQATYTIANAGAAQNGLYYRVVVSNVYGSVVSDPVQLVVTGLGGGPGGGLDCSPWGLAAGTEVRTAFTTALPPSSGEAVMTVSRPVTFDGRALTEVRTVQPLLGVMLDSRLYGDPDPATGEVTQYGIQAATTATSGGTTTTQTTRAVLTTPSVDRQYALAAGETALPRTLNYVETTVTTVNGVDGPPTTANRTETAPAVTFAGIETVTVPAGTFATCKYTSGSTSQWLLRGYGSLVKDSSGGQATQIQVNGTVITGN